VRLLFDENLSVLSAQWAAATLVVDVLDARAAGLAGKTDREVRRFAIETERILVTLDADFGNLIRFSPFWYSWSHLAAASITNRSKHSVNSCKMALQAPRD
jgi:predicted nuclease of predicted toxin-antitoxin system